MAIAQSFPPVVAVFFILFVGGAILGAIIILKTILQGIASAFRGISKSSQGLFNFVVHPSVHHGIKKCSRWNCQCENPAHANFCRRCGNEF